MISGANYRHCCPAVVPTADSSSASPARARAIRKLQLRDSYRRSRCMASCHDVRVHRYAYHCVYTAPANQGARSFLALFPLQFAPMRRQKRGDTMLQGPPVHAYFRGLGSRFYKTEGACFVGAGVGLVSKNGRPGRRAYELNVAASNTKVQMSAGEAQKKKRYRCLCSGRAIAHQSDGQGAFWRMQHKALPAERELASETTENQVELTSADERRLSFILRQWV